MAWIDSDYMDNMITATTRAAVDGGDATVFAQLEAQARSTVESVIQRAGYTSPGATTTNAFLQHLCAGQWVLIAYSARKGLEIPESARQAISMLQEVYDKRLPVPGLDPAAADGIGGVQASVNSETTTGGRPPRFKRDDLTNW